MRVHKLTGLKKQEGIIFEIKGLTAKVARYSKPYGEYIEDEILKENLRLDNYMSVKEVNSSKTPSFRSLVRRAAEDICPNEADVYFEIIY